MILSAFRPNSFRGRGGRRERTVRDVIPTVLADRGGVAHPALDFVAEDGGRDQVAALGSGDLARREHGGEVVARMGRLERQDRCRCSRGSGRGCRWRKPPGRGSSCRVRRGSWPPAGRRPATRRAARRTERPRRRLPGRQASESIRRRRTSWTVASSSCSYRSWAAYSARRFARCIDQSFLVKLAARKIPSRAQAGNLPRCVISPPQRRHAARQWRWPWRRRGSGRSRSAPRRCRTGPPCRGPCRGC